MEKVLTISRYKAIIMQTAKVLLFSFFFSLFFRVSSEAIKDQLRGDSAAGAGEREGGESRADRKCVSCA